MNNDKIAILVDSGSDVPREQVEQYGIYVIPLSIIYKDRTYLDGVDITPGEIYGKLEEEIPGTSLPPGEQIIDILNKIRDDGYEKVLAVTISSGLSGTYNAIRLLAEDFKELDIFVVDTKNIGIGSGMTAVLAAENIEKGLSWTELKNAALNNVGNAKVFFCVSTLKYLQKGGRIGLVTAMFGEKFNIKPIISCNEDGIYYNAAIARGRKKSLEKALELAEEFISKASAQTFNIAVAHGNALDEALELKERVVSRLKGYRNIFEGQISPALVVHTGPGLIGIGVQAL